VASGSSPSPGGEAAASPRGRRLSRATLLWCAGITVALIAWCFFAWIVLDRMFLDAAGEAIGSGLLLLVIVSVVGTLARART
jgi:hypothetical protein